MASLGRRGLEMLCSGDQFALQERGGRGWGHFHLSSLREEGEGILAEQAGLCPVAPGREGKGPEGGWTGPFPWQRGQEEQSGR